MSDEFAWPDIKKSIFKLSTTGHDSPTWCLLKGLETCSYFDQRKLAEEFKRVADHSISYKSAGNDCFNPDGLFLPIAYLYRHSLELMLKHLIGRAVECELLVMDEKLKNILGGHRLDELWANAKTSMEKAWPTADRTVIINVEAIIKDFHKIDNTGQNLRYLKDKKDRSTLTNYPMAIELTDFMRLYEEIFNLLDGVSTEYDMRLDYMNEKRSEMQQEYGGW